MGIEILDSNELPREIVEQLEEITIPKKGILFFGTKAVRFDEPPLKKAQRILVKWRGLLQKLADKVREDLINTYGDLEKIRKQLEKELEELGIDKKDEIVERILAEREKAIVEQLAKSGINILNIPDNLLRLHLADFDADIREIIKVVLDDGGLDKSTVDRLMDAMTPNQTLYNLYAIIALVLYGRPFHELVAQSKQIVEQLKKMESKEETKAGGGNEEKNPL